MSPLTAVFAAPGSTNHHPVALGRRVRQYRRASGELWDSIVMGLPLLGPVGSRGRLGLLPTA